MRRGVPLSVCWAATDGSISSSDAAPPPSKKMTRKEKQQEQSRDQGVQRRQRQLMLQQASLPTPKANRSAGGGKGNEEFDTDDELPQPVFDRIIRRIVVAVGLPVASGVALLNVYDAIKRGQGVEEPTWLPLLTILLSFGTSALGIAYGTLSASWNPEKEGRSWASTRSGQTGPVLWAEEIEKENAKARKKK